jgi:hypothetical protein
LAAVDYGGVTSEVNVDRSKLEDSQGIPQEDWTEETTQRETNPLPPMNDSSWAELMRNLRDQ